MIWPFYFISQISEEAVQKRYKQGWLQEVTNSIDDLIDMLRRYRREQRVTSIGFHGNIVDLWYVHGETFSPW